MEDQEQEAGPEKENNLFLYSILAVLALVAVAILINRSTAAPKNQDINKVVSSDMKVNMQSIVKSDISTEKIAVISVTGIIGSPGLTEKVTAELRSASSDANIKAVILKVESPGGGVYDIDLIWKEVMKFKESKKPMVAFFAGVAASGGYYISAPADKIMATPATITGSIGTILQALNYAGLMKKLGVKIMTFKSGKQKDMLSPYREMDPETEKILQDWIDEDYNEFVRVVSQGRKLDEETVRKLADGRIYTARQAVKNRLIDSVGYFEDAVELAKKLANSPNASVVEMNAIYTRSNLFYESLRVLKKIRENPADKYMPPNGMYYLAPGLYEKHLDR